MNKKEAAEYLGISVRQVENYASDKDGRIPRLAVRKVRGKTGDITIYDDNDLKNLKKELDKKRAPRPSLVTKNNESSESNELIRASDSRLSDVPNLTDLIKVLSDGRKALSVADISCKPLLTIKEAALLTGLSSDRLSGAIKSGLLKGKKIGNPYRVKREDLDEYIKSL